MIKVGKAFTKEDFDSCCFVKTNKEHFVYNGIELTAENIWEMNESQREEVIDYIIGECRKNGFPYKQLLYNIYNSDDYVFLELDKFRRSDETKIVSKNGLIKNAGKMCLDICRYMNQDIFWKSRGDDGTISIEEAYNDDDVLRNVLRNRMGWCTTTERGCEEPYIFDMSYEMIIQGIRSSRVGFAASNFKPIIAKYIYGKYLKYGDKVFDYSCGWGARMIAAWSLNLQYIGVDPLTADNLKTFDKRYLDGDFDIYKSCSESKIAYNRVRKKYGNVDMCLSCPPYFTLEKYSDNEKQCYNKFDNYKDWITKYWRKTVKNCYSILKDGGYFVLIIKDKYDTFNLKDDMCKVIEKCGMTIVETLQYDSSRDHLTQKRKTGVVMNNSEYILVYKK